MNFKKMIWVVAFLLGLSTGAQATHVHSFRQEVFALGMGGAYTAGTWRGSALFYNPAALGVKRFHLNFPFRIEFGGVGGLTQFTEVVDFFQDNKETLDHFAEVDVVSDHDVARLDNQALALDGTGSTVRILPAVRVGWSGWSFQSYASVVASPTLDNGIYQPRIQGDGIADVGAIIGHGRRIRLFKKYLKKWYLGMAVKGFRRYSTSTAFTFQESTKGLSFTDAVEIADPKTGYGMDIGALFVLDRSFNLGVVAQDALTFGDVQPDPSVNVGIHYQPIPMLHLVADYRDVFNAEEHPMPMHVHFGAEVDMVLLAFRGGFYQGYPTLGFGINLWLIKLDVLYYTQERGERLGDAPETNLAFELQIGLD